MSRNGDVIPLQVDLSDLVRRSVATLYSHLVTRPTGEALRLGIESQIGELTAPCLSILDFRQVVVLDYSCADEVVAKLVRRFAAEDRPSEAFFVARGVCSHRHRPTLEAVLERQRLAMAAEVEDYGYTLLGAVSPIERSAWEVLAELGEADAHAVALRLARPEDEAMALLSSLARHRTVVLAGGRFRAVNTLITVPR